METCFILILGHPEQANTCLIFRLTKKITELFALAQFGTLNTPLIFVAREPWLPCELPGSLQNHFMRSIIFRSLQQLGYSKQLQSVAPGNATKKNEVHKSKFH